MGKERVSARPGPCFFSCLYLQEDPRLMLPHILYPLQKQSKRVQCFGLLTFSQFSSSARDRRVSGRKCIFLETNRAWETQSLSFSKIPASPRTLPTMVFLCSPHSSDKPDCFGFLTRAFCFLCPLLQAKDSFRYTDPFTFSNLPPLITPVHLSQVSHIPPLCSPPALQMGVSLGL